MALTYKLLLYVHVVIGFISLLLFWIPVVSRKGSPIHKRFGKWFANAMYTVAGSAFFMSLMLIAQPLASKYSDTSLTAEQLSKAIYNSQQTGLLLLALSMLVLCNIRHGLLSLKAKHNHSLMRQPSHLLLNSLLLINGLNLAIAANADSGPIVLFYIFAALCSFTAIGNLRYSLKQRVSPMDWKIAHMNSMISAGIASYTAFFVIGGNQFLAEFLPGAWSMVPWIAPGVIGGICIAMLSIKYRRLNNSAKA